MSAIVFISFKYGFGGWSVLDRLCLLTSFIGLFFWWCFNSPLLALYISIAIDFIGAIPTLKKSYNNPEGENFLTWKLFFTANLINLLAIEKWTLDMAGYPLYLCGISGSIFIILWIRKK